MAEPIRPTPLHLFGQLCILAAVRANHAAFVWEHGGRSPMTSDTLKPSFNRYKVPHTYADDQLREDER